MSQLPYIDEKTLFDLVGWSDAVTALERALRDGLSPAAALDRSITDVANGQLLLMPAENDDKVYVGLMLRRQERFRNGEKGMPHWCSTDGFHETVTAGATSHEPARMTASSIAWQAPWPMSGVIGWAESPSKVARPMLQCGSGGRS